MDVSDLDPCPMTQFAKWFAEAAEAGLPEPNAMVLATMGDRPHARTVLLKAHDADGFTFYTNRTSRKGNDLAADSRCCAVFPWYALGRQVTVEGSARPLSMAESEPYYRSRERRSQIAAWASRQSRVLSARAELDDRVAELEQRWPEGTRVPMPDFWGGYLITPDTVEFWRSGGNRLHDRLRYRRSGEDWDIERLSPLFFGGYTPTPQAPQFVQPPAVESGSPAGPPGNRRGLARGRLTARSCARRLASPREKLGP